MKAPPQKTDCSIYTPPVSVGWRDGWLPVFANYFPVYLQNVEDKWRGMFPGDVVGAAVAELAKPSLLQDDGEDVPSGDSHASDISE